METSNNFMGKLQRNPKEILEIFEALSKICQVRFEGLSGTENTANIFQNNILLVVSPLTAYCMKRLFALFLAFLWCVYIKKKKHNIDKYRYKKIFDILISWRSHY